MAVVTLSSDFGAPKIKSDTVSTVSPSVCHEVKGTTEDEMAGWHHQLNGHGFGWTLGTGDGQGGLACCSSWGHKELDTIEQLN